MQLDGKYYFNVRIQQYSDFLQQSDVIAFSMKENCGAAGVVFELAFHTANRKIADLIIENNEIIFEIGESAEKAIAYKAYISEHPTKDDSKDDATIMVSLVATLINMSFYTTRASETVFGTSLDMIKKMATTYLGKDAKVEVDKPTEVEHNWLRSYETGAITMMQAWLHMNLPKTTPLLWIDTTNTVHVSDIERIKKGGIKHKFVPAQGVVGAGEKPYLNCFTTKSYKFDTNLITGKNTIVNVSNIESGDDTVSVPENKPDLASTSQVEAGEVGNKVVDNKYQTDNVHSKFMICYYVNKLRLIQLSSHIGNLELAGFYPEINICDLVEVTGCQANYSGRYLVNTKITYFGANRPLKTIVAVCRDNTNSIEDSAITPKSQVVMYNQQLTDIMQSIRTLRRVTVMGTKLLDGTTKNQIIGYCKSFKYNALNSFQVMGTPLNLNSSLEIMNSLKNIGINLMKSIIDKYIPYPYNLMLHNLLLDGFSFKKLLSQLVVKYLPPYLRDLIQEILGLLNDLTCLANALHKQNSKKLSDYTYTSGGYSADTNRSTGTTEGGNASGTPTNRSEYVPTEETNEMSIDNTQQNTEDIKNITDELLDNVDGLDIPIPEITISESENLLPKDELKELIAERVVEYLDGQGYLESIGQEAFLAILLGRKPLDFNTMKLINANIGNMLYARYWGTYTGEITKLGRLESITSKTIVMPNVDVTEDLYNGDNIVINGTDASNGTYTVVSVEFDGTNSQIVVLEDIVEYSDDPVKAYTDIAPVATIVTGQDSGDRTIITLTGRFNQFLPVGKEVRVAGLDDDETFNVSSISYDRSSNTTTIGANVTLISDLSKAGNLQVVTSLENSTSVSKLSNQDFTDFYIKNGFKDVYATVPCTKIINALRGAKIWIALPNIVDDIEFYINSELVEMDVMEGFDLNMYAPGGAKLYYNVYMSQGTYNSNSVTLEVRRKV